MSTIVNTTVLSNFAVIDQLDLLRQLFTTLYIPTFGYYSPYTDLSPLLSTKDADDD
jgi:predicted nucleic acid-binding protein